MELSDWNMERPPVLFQMTQAICCQAETFANPDARGTHQKQCVCDKVIGFSHLLFKTLVDLG